MNGDDFTDELKEQMSQFILEIIVVRLQRHIVSIYTVIPNSIWYVSVDSQVSVHWALANSLQFDIIGFAKMYQMQSIVMNRLETT